MTFPIISFILFLPALGAVALMLIQFGDDKDKDKDIKAAGIFFSSLTFLASIPLLILFGDASSSFISNFSFEEQYYWIDPNIIKTSYHVKIDGISILLVILTTFITPITILASWNSIKTRVKEFIVCILLLEFGMIGALTAWDFLLFYFFWEIMLIPMYFIIGIWGSENKIYAAVKFFIYTMVGSLLMFIALLWIYFEVGSFDFNAVFQHQIDPETQVILFAAFALSFAIKVPIFPFHTWLPDAHVQAPTAGSVILAGILLKMGTYGFIRFAIPVFPHPTTQYADVFSVLALIGIIYGAMMALAQTDIKKLIAYSSISHLGFVMLGLFAFQAVGLAPGGTEQQYQISYQAVQGALYQMIAHGLSTGALFLLVGMIYERRHTKEMKAFGGLAKVMPIYAVMFMITTLASIGLPGLSGFVGEFLILMGTFQGNRLYGVLAATGVILGAVYMLVLYQRVFFGECTKAENLSLKDLDAREIILLLPMVALMIIMGVFPNYFLDKMTGTLDTLFDTIPHIRWTS